MEDKFACKNVQVHRAVLSARGAANTDYAPKTTVAVKVRHPGVSELMQRDVMLMQRAAKLTKFIPGLSAMRLDESIRQVRRASAVSQHSHLFKRYSTAFPSCFLLFYFLALSFSLFVSFFLSLCVVLCCVSFGVGVVTNRCSRHLLECCFL